MRTVMPCFAHDQQAKAEGEIIGRLLAGYGELELVLATCIAATTGGDLGLDAAIKCLFRVRGAEKRIKIGSVMVGDLYRAAGLGKLFATTIKNMERCRDIRNQYAHCHWYWTGPEGLCVVALEETAKIKTTVERLTDNRVPVDVPLLRLQEEFFWNVRECLGYLAEQYRIRQIGSDPAAKLRSPLYILPAVMAKPPLHN